MCLQGYWDGRERNIITSRWEESNYLIGSRKGRIDNRSNIFPRLLFKFRPTQPRPSNPGSYRKQIIRFPYQLDRYIRGGLNQGPV